MTDRDPSTVLEDEKEANLLANPVSPFQPSFDGRQGSQVVYIWNRFASVEAKDGSVNDHSMGPLRREQESDQSKRGG
ncbi:MAG: hypothetical protein GC165_18115 [Armatimonadetes bacterium]|nr:hypothetical protein [Armatimonadota bacterium]